MSALHQAPDSITAIAAEMRDPACLSGITAGRVRIWADRLEALGDDAARYRWLRGNCKREWESDMAHNKGAPSLDIDFSADGHDLDAAIDAAMTGESHD